MRKLALTVCLLFSVLMSGPLFATATGTIAPFPEHQFFDANGDPCNACLLFTYTAGTSTKVNTFTEVTLSSANTNPIVLPSTGRATIFLTPGQSYKFVLAPPTDTDPPASAYWTVDSVQAVPPTGTATDVDITGTAGEALSAGDAVYLSDGTGGTTSGRWYKADADNTYSSSVAQGLGFATAAISSASSGTIRVAGRITGLSGLTAGTLYYVSATGGALTSTAPTNARSILQADATTSGVILARDPVASATVQGGIALGTQTLGTGTKTVDGLAVNATPNWKPGSDAALDAYGCATLRSLVDTTQHANSGTGETTATSISFPAGALATNGAYATFHFGGSNAANANTKTIKFKFGATVVTLENGATNGGFWAYTIWVVRTGAATQKILVLGGQRSAGTGDFLPSYTTAAETLSGAITVVTTLQSNTASSDIIQEVFLPGVCG